MTMNINEDKKSIEALELELKLLRREISGLGKYKHALKIQEKLFKSILTMSNVASGKIMLRTILLEIIDFSVRLLHAEGASLFLLSPDGLITESILARGPTIQEDKTRLIGEILDKGLAGWVARYRQIGLVEDTWEDERWFNLPEQPYDVRSAIAIPFLRGTSLLGVLTLTHSEPKKFTQSMVQFMDMYSPSLTLALDHARIHLTTNN